MKSQKAGESYCLRNVTIWNSDSVLESQNVWVKGGRIDRIEAAQPSMDFPDGLEFIDGQGRVLIPAGVDVQVHLRVPGQAEKETAETGLRAAVRGGYAAILTMPNTRPVIDTPEVLELGRREVKKAQDATGVDVLWSVALTRGQDGLELVDIEALAKAGASAFTDDGKGIASDEIMNQAFARLQDVGVPFLQHAEVPGHGGVLAPGPIQRAIGVKAYPADAEWKMVERDLKLLENSPRARYHVLHVSSKESIALVKAARAKGLRATAEVSPHHLFFTTEDISAKDSSFKMNPPIRSPDDRAALIRGLRDGDIDFVATDHAPHEATKKTRDFANSAFGTTGLETALRVLMDLYQKRQIGPSRLVEVFSTAPAKFLNLDKKLGRIEKGRPMHAVLIDPQAAPQPVSPEELESLSKNNCFIGQKLGGRIETVFQPKQIWIM